MKHKKRILRTAHYSTIGTTEEEISDLWIVCHGYAQLAENFIQDFQPLEKKGRLIIAPEGLSRFYWGGFTGPVVSSWMTKGDRLDEIKDYCDWLDVIYAMYSANYSKSIKITLLGFSQGCATAMRWIHARKPKIDRLILWAGSTPEDIDYLPLNQYFSGMEKYFVYGLQDKFLTEERLNWQKSFLKDQQLKFKEIPFDGKHKIYADALKQFE